MARPRKAATADGEALRNDAGDLRDYIERIENVNELIKDHQSDRKEIYTELRAAGYDVAAVRAIIRRRAMDPDKRAVHDANLELYMQALGDFASTPLGVAGADRVREDVRV